jgi:hypothetical protein
LKICHIKNAPETGHFYFVTNESSDLIRFKIFGMISATKVGKNKIRFLRN